jgi:hypothetical protein
MDIYVELYAGNKINCLGSVGKEEPGHDEEEEKLGREGHSVIRCTMETILDGTMFSLMSLSTHIELRLNYHSRANV